MNKAIKFKNNTYLDSTSIVHNKENLKTILDDLLNKNNLIQYHPGDMDRMKSENHEEVIDVSHNYLFYTDWKDYSLYNTHFAGVLGIYLKGSDFTSTGGVAIIFFYGGAIGVNIRIDSNRWGGWKWF